MDHVVVHRRDPDEDARWFGLGAFLVCLPVVLAVLSPYLYWLWLRRGDVDRWTAFALAGGVVAIGALVWSLTGVWWALFTLFLVGAASSLLLWAQERHAVPPAEEKVKEGPDYYLHS